MPAIETASRLDLIQLAVNCLGGLKGDELREITGLIEALCRHRELPVSACLSPPRVAILQRECPDSFRDWQAGYMVNE